MLKYLHGFGCHLDQQHQFDQGSRASRVWCLASRQTRLCPEVRRETPRTATGTVALPKKIIRNYFGKGLFIRNISEIFLIIRNFTTFFNPAFQRFHAGEMPRRRMIPPFQRSYHCD